MCMAAPLLAALHHGLKLNSCQHYLGLQRKHLFHRGEPSAPFSVLFHHTKMASSSDKTAIMAAYALIPYAGIPHTSPVLQGVCIVILG